jgi:hypothetical protein
LQLHLLVADELQRQPAQLVLELSNLTIERFEMFPTVCAATGGG